jgi:glucose-1-phosphate cytidylyltransferase
MAEFCFKDNNCHIDRHNAKNQYGILKEKGGTAYEFEKKLQTDQIINGGYFVLNKELFNYVADDNGRYIFEQELLAKLVAAGQLSVYLYKESWMSIDTYKDYSTLNDN